MTSTETPSNLVAVDREEYDKACKRVADMHAAAVGEIRGPIRGVIEDVVDVRTIADLAICYVECPADDAETAWEEMAQAVHQYRAREANPTPAVESVDALGTLPLPLTDLVTKGN